MGTEITGVKKNIFLSIAVMMLGLLVVAGTYAYIYISSNITNGTYNGSTDCFVIDYTAGDAITGILFQSSTPKGGLFGSVTMNINSNCNISGKGTIKLNVSDSTDKRLVGDAHCENSKTLKTIACAKTENNFVYGTDCSDSNKFLVDQSNCTTVINGVWVAENATPPLKYAVYEGVNSEPVASGFVNSIGDVTLYTGFDITNTSKTYSIYVWLDGNMADNSYVNMPFNGHVHAEAIQTE